MACNGPGHAVVGTPAHSFVNKGSDCRDSNQQAMAGILKLQRPQQISLPPWADERFLMAAYRWHSTTKCGRATKPFWA